MNLVRPRAIASPSALASTHVVLCGAAITRMLFLWFMNISVPPQCQDAIGLNKLSAGAPPGVAGRPSTPSAPRRSPYGCYQAMPWKARCGTMRAPMPRWTEC
ncbi:MAG: hypothetical protein AAGA68_01490 [Pseudomonadota bacterium]